MSERACLVVDDDEAVRVALQLLLENEGYVVRTAACAADAWSLCRAQRFGAFLIDAGLPGVNGLDLGRELHGAFGAGGRRFILISGDNADWFEHTRESLWADGFLSKPVSAGGLRHVLRGPGSA